ncbi:TPA: hypothetical protein ACOSBD_004590, partial [Escherichia coli]
QSDFLRSEPPTQNRNRIKTRPHQSGFFTPLVDCASFFSPSFEGLSLSVFLLQSMQPVALTNCLMPTVAFS